MAEYTLLVYYYNGNREIIVVKAAGAHEAFQKVLANLKHEPKYIMLLSEGVRS